MQTGAPNLALPHLRAAAGTDKDGSLHYQLARAYQMTGQPARAAQATAESRKLSVQSPIPIEPEMAPPQ
jgi:predicted Zn-dependent protease